MIATLTLNPALDKLTEVNRLIPEKKMRCPDLKTEAGGGGINVSKAINELEGESIAVFPCGGTNGDILKEILNRQMIRNEPVQINENTRENFTVDEIDTNKQFRFVMKGPSLSEANLDSVKRKISELSDIEYLVCSGSMPADVPFSFIGEIAEIANSKKMKLIVDTSGEALKTALQKGVYMLKPNLTELGFLAGKEHLDSSEIEDTAEQIINSGKCDLLVVSLGPSGALLVTKNEKKKFSAPIVKKISTVGAGDSMVAGTVWMLQKGETLENAVQFGIACGTAATINKGTRLFKKEDAEKFYNWMRI